MKKVKLIALAALALLCLFMTACSAEPAGNGDDAPPATGPVEEATPAPTP